MLGGHAGRKRGGINYKTTIRMETAVVMETKGFVDGDIAKHLGLSKAGLATLKRNPLYAAIRRRILNNVVGELEQDLGTDLLYAHHKLNNMLPKALQVLADNLESPDGKLRQIAAESVLDRNGRLAKISRIGLPTEEQGGIGPKIDTSTADALIAGISSLKNGNVNNASTSSGKP